jgi:sulfate permease, SulP family
MSELDPVTPAALNLASNARAMLRHLRGSWAEVASGKHLISDLLAGLTVAAVALPLNVALAKTSGGLPASAGLVAGAVGGIVAGALGGTPLQVSGPAAALSTMVGALALGFGATGVAAACLMIGVVQLALALLGAGRFARYVPESILAGFTTGVGLRLLDQKIPEILGFKQLGYDYKLVDLAGMMHQPQWLHHVSWHAAVCGLVVAFLVTRLRQFKRFPAAIIGIALATFVSVYLHWDVERVGDVPSRFPLPSIPIVDDERWFDLAAQAIPIGLLAAVESLLSARAVNRLAPQAAHHHHPNLEIFGQGVANLASGLMGGMPVSGVVARSGVNVQSGARTRLASIVHGVLLVLAVLHLARFIEVVPTAALAGLLCVVGARLIEWTEFVHLAKTHRLEAASFLAAALGTLSGHLITGLVVAGAIHLVHRFANRHEASLTHELAEAKAKGARAIIKHDVTDGRMPGHWEALPEHHKWLTNIRGQALRAKSAFVHEQASVIGKVVMRDHVHIAAGSSVRADEGAPFFFGENTNLQDGVIVHALKDRHVLVGGEPWAVYVGKRVSVAHNAIVHGPCFIGDDTFIGFKAVVHDSVVGAHCFIGHGAIVVGVELPDGRLVPNGRIVDSADAVALLGPATSQHKEFNEDVVEVNRGLAAAYHENGGTTARAGRAALEDERVLAAPLASWDERWGVATTKGRF